MALIYKNKMAYLILFVLIYQSVFANPNIDLNLISMRAIQNGTSFSEEYQIECSRRANTLSGQLRGLAAISSRATADYSVSSDSARYQSRPADEIFISPVQGNIHLHNRRGHVGLDISGNNGAVVSATLSGRVVSSSRACPNHRVDRCNGGRGNFIEIQHENGLTSRYYHLSNRCQIPAPGTSLSTGQNIGCVGNSGRSTGPHLHFEVARNRMLFSQAELIRIATNRQ